MSCACAPASARSQATTFVDTFEAAYGATTPPPFAGEAYDATNAVLAAIRSGAATPPEVAAYLDAHSFTGAMKTFRFQADGNLAVGLAYIAQVKQAALVPVAALG
jgi:ABC-type branched-subunit amino acid transport system substrate-binding protein